MEEEEEEGKMSEAHLTSAAAFVEGGIQDACDDACSICLEAFCDSDPSTVSYAYCKILYLFYSRVGIWWIVLTNPILYILYRWPVASTSFICNVFLNGSANEFNFKSINLLAFCTAVIVDNNHGSGGIGLRWGCRHVTVQ